MIRAYYRMEHLLKVLRYEKEPGGYLHGADLDFAVAMHGLDGKLGLLEAVDEDGFIHITDPVLQSLGGEVLSVEKRKRQARVRISLLGQPKIIQMNYRLQGKDGQPLSQPEEMAADMMDDETDEWPTAWTPDFADRLMEKIDEGQRSEEEEKP